MCLNRTDTAILLLDMGILRVASSVPASVPHGPREARQLNFSNLNGLLGSFDVPGSAAGRAALPVAALYFQSGTHSVIVIVAQHEFQVSRTW